MRLLRALRGRFRDHKLSRDIAFTLGSFMVLAASGIVINVVITSTRDAAALGVFNQTYAIYIVASQVAALGVHYSVLRYAAFYDGDGQQLGLMLRSGLMCTLVLGVLAAIALFACAHPIGQKLGSSDTAASLAIASLGLLLFPANKVLIAYLNGQRRMRAYALLQGARYLIVMAVVSLVAASTVPIEMAALAFICAEAVTFVSAVIVVQRAGSPLTGRVSMYWVREHGRFGSRGLLAGLFTEANSRIDVVMIGLFLPDREVGIYSFGAMLVDGMYHVLAMVRINFNPLLVAAMRDGRWESPMKLLTICKRYVLPGAVLVSIGLLGLLYVAGTWIMPGKGLVEGMASVSILLAGLVAVSPYVPFDNLMLSVGKPERQTLQYFAAAVANVVLAALLLPHFGIEGAAAGTAFSYIAAIALLVVFARREVGWDLIRNRFIR